MTESINQSREHVTSATLQLTECKSRNVILLHYKVSRHICL